jgi:arylsulfatase A-like enzyme
VNLGAHARALALALATLGGIHACGRQGSTAVVNGFLLIAGERLRDAPPACALADDTRPAHGCPPLKIMPVERQKAVDERPLERVISLEAPYVGTDCLIERLIKDAGASRWVPLPPIVVRNAPPTVRVSYPVSPSLVGKSVDLWVQARLVPPAEHSFETQPVRVPPDGFLRGAVGVERIGAGSDAPVAFRLVARTAARELVLFERTLDGGPAADTAGWTDYRIDLAELAGESVRFGFSTRALAPAGDAHDAIRFPLWAAPRLLGSVRRARRPNVILVSLDTLRADHVGAYGCDLPTTPVLDRLAGEGIVFERALTTYPSTTAGHMSMLTGVYPVGHEVISPLTALHPAIPTLAELLAAQGYETAAVTENGMLSIVSGFGRGFMRYREFKGATSVVTAGHAAEVVDEGLRWIAEHREAPFFVFLHTYQVHGPYTPPPGFDLWKTYRKDGEERPITAETPGEIRDRYAYAGEVRYTDSQVGRLLDGLVSLGEAERTLVIITSDHGESFRYREGLLGHGWNVFDDTLRVPLIMRAPGLVPAGRRVAPPVSLVDITPTVLDLVEVPVPPTVEGRSLVPLFRDGGAPGFADRPVFAEVRIQTKRLVAIQQGPRKWIMDANAGGGRVYQPADDPAEERDLATPELLAEGTALLRRYESHREAMVERLGLAAPAAAVPDPRTADKLKALGYVE